MKTTALAVVMSFLILSGWALAAQTAEQTERPAMLSNPMMQEMMKGGKGGERMAGMMRMMKMMDRCAATMESAKADSDEPQQGRKK